VFGVVLLNWVVYCGVSVYMLGGTALFLNTPHKDGIYYFENHGAITEVSYSSYLYSLIHGYASILLIITAIIFAGYFLRKAENDILP
jgi:hypothetical protein